MGNIRKVHVGTRGSPLATTQTGQTVAALAAANGLTSDDFVIETIKTSGDVILDRPLMAAGGKGLFTKELEEALYAERVAIAVHSGKDMPTKLPEGLVLGCWLPREDPRDVLISRNGGGIDELPQGARVGTSALRRRGQLKHYRPDLDIVPLRGNVGTRRDTVAAGDVDATLLAMAGLNRLGAMAADMVPVAPELMLPSPAQGAIVIECREDDAPTRALLDRLNDRPTEIEVTVERAFLEALDGSCRTPIAGLARYSAGTVTFHGRLIDMEGTRQFEIRDQATVAGELEAARTLGLKAGEALRAEAGESFFKELSDAMQEYEALRL